MPIVHVLFSNVKTWLNGTYHGVSAKHLPRRAMAQPTITYRQLIDGLQPECAFR